MQACNDLADEDSPSQDVAENPSEVTVRLLTVFGSFGAKRDIWRFGGKSDRSNLTHVYR